MPYLRKRSVPLPPTLRAARRWSVGRPDVSASCASLIYSSLNGVANNGIEPGFQQCDFALLRVDRREWQ